MSSELELLTELKSQLLVFLEELIEQFPDEGDLIIIRIFLKDQLPIHDIMLHIIEHLVPLKSLVVSKNDKFFLENTVLFEELKQDNVNHFKKLWQSGVLSEEDKDVIWEWFLFFIEHAEKYQKTYA